METRDAAYRLLAFKFERLRDAERQILHDFTRLLAQSRNGADAGRRAASGETVRRAAAGSRLRPENM